MEGDFFKFSNLNQFPELVQGISTKSFGSMKMLVSDPQIIKNRENFARTLGINPGSLVVTENVHGNSVAVVGKTDAGHGSVNHLDSIRGVDALITRDSGVNLMITVADCLPIVAYDPIESIIGIAHAGWRGILAGIGTSFINEFKRLGSNPENIVIGIGPGICQKHFIVKNETLKKFKDAYSRATFIRNHDGYVDLKICMTEQLLKAGIAKYNLEVAPECTVCNNYYFGSFRSDGDKAVYQAVIIGKRG